MVTPYINFDDLNEQKNINFDELNNLLDDLLGDTPNKPSNKYFDLITQYLHKNLNKILSEIDFPREKNGSYIYTWQGNNGEISYTEDSKPVFEYLKDHKQQIVGDDDDVDWNAIVDEYSRTSDFIQFGKQIRAYIINANNKVIKQRANFLEQLNDKINDYISIDYNPASDHERDKPIVIIRVKINDKIQDKIYIGKSGQSHGGLISSIIMPELLSIHATVPEPVTLYQAYLLGTIAFMDPSMPNTYDDLDYVKKLLINDDRITKVYTVPVKDTASGNIVRVARLYKIAKVKKNSISE